MLLIKLCYRMNSEKTKKDYEGASLIIMTYSCKKKRKKIELYNVLKNDSSSFYLLKRPFNGYKSFKVIRVMCTLTLDSQACTAGIQAVRQRYTAFCNIQANPIDIL